ncbi:MAG: protein kinase [Acidobacteriota bacterium]
MSSLSGKRLGPYEILSPLGAGGMGEVYKARDTRLGREVAVKVLPQEFAAEPERLRRFEQEAKASAALDHPNILAVFDVGTHEGTPYIVEQLLEGESLRQRLRTGPLPPAKAVEFGIQIAQGLAAAHERSIVHRDLKPENLFITRDGRVKILDFGLARLRPQGLLQGEPQTEAPTVDSPTREGRVLGTVGYMSPEQARGLPADARSDIFAFGVVLYEMLAGKRAFGGDTAADTQAAILSKDPDPLPSVTPQSLDRVVRRCLEKRPEDRYHTAHELLLALEVASTSPAPPAPAPVAAVPEARGWFKRRWVLAGAVAILLAPVLSGILLWHPWRKKPSPSGTMTSAVPSLVALPCKVLGSPESAYLTDAIPSTISTLLGEVQGMDTKVPPTSFEVEKVHGDLDKIADAYRVQAFVLSTATAEGDHLIFNIQVADAKTRRVRWSHEYQGSRENYLAMAREAAQGICRAVLPDAALAVPASSSASTSESELAFQQGKFYLLRYANHDDRADLDRALGAFKRAFELNPKDALAAAWIAQLYFRSQLGGQLTRAHNMTEGEAWVQGALALDPQCSEAWVSKARLESAKLDADMRRQIEWSLKGAELGPTNPQAQGALAIQGLLTGGSLLLGIEAEREVLKLDPLFFLGYSFLAYPLTELGHPEEALQVLDTGLSLDPGNLGASACKGYALVEMSRTKEATALLKGLEASRILGFWGQFVQDDKWLLSLAAGDDRDARSSLKAIIAHFADPTTDWNLMQWEIAFLLPSINRRFGKDAALDLLILSTNRGATMPYDMLMLRPDLKNLREDPRAKEVIAKTKAPFDLLIRILQDARASGECPKYIEKPMDNLLKDLESRGAWP